jgi:glycosyltransferase involved in cell wall biosynthesis
VIAGTFFGKEFVKVLLIAEAANPEWASVPLVGWSLAKALRKRADVHIVTHLRNRAAIERAGLVEGKDFTALDTDRQARFWLSLIPLLRGGPGVGWTTEMALATFAYRHFEAQLWHCFGAAIVARQYDIVHRITPLSPTVVSTVAPRCADAGVPFVLGPLNGGVPWPAAFDAARRREREWLSYVRGVYKWMPGHGKMLRSSQRILVGSRHTEADIPPALRSRCIYLPENAVDPARFTVAPQARFELPLRAAFVGRMVPYKGPDMLLAASEPLLAEGRLSIDMVGDGPMRQELEAWVEQRGLAEHVHFHGWVEHQAVQTVLAQAHVFGFPSIREFGGGAVLEAMVLGVVPIVVNYAGPGELVDDSVGYRVTLGTRSEVVAGFRARLEALCNDPSPLPAMSAAGRSKVLTEFTWDAKAERILGLYGDLMRRASIG